MRYEEAPLHLALGEVAVAPKLSATEGSGKLLTYMAAGLPVAAFDTPVHREYLGEEGCYAPAGDAAALAEAIARLLDRPAEAAARGAALRGTRGRGLHLGPGGRGHRSGLREGRRYLASTSIVLTQSAYRLVSTCPSP